MKKLLSLGIITAASPLALVVACGNPNDGNTNGGDTDPNQYKPLAVGVKLKDLNDEDLWVFSSVHSGNEEEFTMNSEEWKNGFDKYRARISSRMTQSHDLIYPKVTQKEYDDILVKGRDILNALNWIKTRYDEDVNSLSIEDLSKIHFMQKYYNHYKNSTIKNKIDTKFEWGDGTTDIAKWL